MEMLRQPSHMMTNVCVCRHVDERARERERERKQILKRERKNVSESACIESE